MNRKLAEKLIDVDMGRLEADYVIRNVRLVNVFSSEIEETDVYVVDGFVAGFRGSKKARKEIDAKGRYLVPGFIDGHCHIESSHLSPTAFSDSVVPFGTTTVIADPHEICNVCGNAAMDYMIKSAANAPLSIYYMYPSCVPATPFEHAGCTLLAKDMKEHLAMDQVKGLGEMMNYPGIANHDGFVMDKLEEAWKLGKNIDGHAPDVHGDGLEAYVASGISTDHECFTPEELQERTRLGMYVLLRQGTACKNVLGLLPGVNDGNYRRCLFCTDDRQPQTIKQFGHVSHGINLAIGAGLDPVRAITMATLNAAECFRLDDRGAIAPGKRADFFLCDDLKEIKPNEVFILGKKVAENGRILENAKAVKPEGVSGRMHVANFSEERLAMHLESDHVRCINIIPGGVVTGAGEAIVKRDGNGNWVHNPEEDVLKLAVVERHNGLGNIALAPIRGYGMKNGAVATSIAHDSHNIIVIGSNDHDMAVAVEELIRLGGGITMVQDGKVIDSHRLEIAGLMTDENVDDVCQKLEEMHKEAEEYLHVNPEIDPFMTLCFMALPVIPEYKLTDMGLFDVRIFDFVPLEID